MPSDSVPPAVRDTITGHTDYPQRSASGIEHRCTRALVDGHHSLRFGSLVYIDDWRVVLQVTDRRRAKKAHIPLKRPSHLAGYQVRRITAIAHW